MKEVCENIFVYINCFEFGVRLCIVWFDVNCFEIKRN